VIAGVSIGALVTAWALLMGVTGWVVDPDRAPLFGLVVVYELVVLAVLLRSTQHANAWRRQVATGTLAGLVAAPIVLAQSLAFTTVLFPEVLAAQPERGTAIEQALAGAIGTVTTAVIGSAILGALWRRRA